jgi:2,5-diketo-D-gluconate reductase A
MLASEPKKFGAYPISVFWEASRYGLSIAEEGMEKQRKQELHWHDPYGIREALLYSFRNACIASKVSDATCAKALKLECMRFTKNTHASLRAARSILKQVIGDDRHGTRKGDVMASCKFQQLNAVRGPAKTDNIKTSGIELPDGNLIPRLGFGTALFAKSCSCITGHRCQACEQNKDVVHAAVVGAVKHGYRHFDCAQCYNNEEVIGAALMSTGLPRHELFLASKLSSWEDYGASATRKLVLEQLRKLKTNYLDLYYLHDDIEDLRKEKAAWRALERLHREGVIKHLGLSNYRTSAIKRVMSYANICPSVVQVKYDVYHPGYQWAESGLDNVVAFARDHGIAVVGYANFSGWPSLLRAREDPHIHNIAQRYKRTPEQVILRHCLQKGLVLIPASTRESNIELNAHVFDFSLSEHDVAYLDGLAGLVAFQPISWLPANHGSF